MIEITDRSKCSGCGACRDICPVACITIQKDAEGFLYPIADTSLCIDCGRCDKACPFITPQEQKPAGEAHLLVASDKGLRAASSSGGAFSLLAERVIADKGIVWGAAFDKDWNVVHTPVTTREGLSILRGSKYVESRLGDTFTQIKQQLDAGKRVLFTGTPCQVAGLQRYIGKPHPLLLTVDIACHGIPSAMIWGRWLDEKCSEWGCRRSDITAISFRDKTSGWKGYSFTLTYSTGSYTRRHTSYTLGFAHDLFLRPSCHHCKVKECGSYADLTIADAWGVTKVSTNLQYTDDKGVSLLFTHTDKGRTAFASLTDCTTEPIDAAAMLQHNRYICASIPENKERKQFFEAIERGATVRAAVKKAHRISWSRRIERWLTPLMKRLGIKGFTNKWRRK